MFLKILGVVFLIVLSVVAYFGWKIYRFRKEIVNSDISRALSVLPSMDMELEPSNKDEWAEKELLKYNESVLKKVGATHVGYYSIYSGHAIIKISIWNFKQQAVAAIYEASTDIAQDNHTFIYEISCKTEDGSFCITSNNHAVYGSRPVNHKLIHRESNSIIELLNLMKSELPKGSKIQKIVDSKEFFIECYEDTSEWSWREGQLRSEKNMQVMASIGVDLTDEMLEELIEMGQSYSVELNINRARRILAKNAKMSAAQWEKIRDRLVFINEKMQSHQLVNAIYEIGGDLTETQEKVIEGFEETSTKLSDPISAFQMLIQSMNLKTKRLAVMNQPIKTEVYLSEY